MAELGLSEVRNHGGVLVLVISTSCYDSITYYDGLPYLLPTCFSFIAAL